MKKSKRLQWLIFGCVVSVSTAIALLCVFATSFFLLNNSRQEYRENLATETGYIADGLELAGIDYLYSLSDNAAHRITWVAADGSVLFDSQAEAARLPSHADREEIIEALETGVGDAVRYSDTMARQTEYWALRLADGTVIRLSAQRSSDLAMLGSAALPLLVLLLALVGASILLARWAAGKIVEPINHIDLQQPDTTPVYTELVPLTQRIQEQNKQIAFQMEHLNAEHARQDKFRREFTANVSHELKTPLTSISGFAEIIRDGLVRPEDVKSFAGNIYKEAQRLILLVGDIIKISRMDDDSLPIQIEPIDLYELCQNVMESLAMMAKKSQVNLSLTGSHGTIQGAYQIAEEMVHNLCENAIKYNRSGGMVEVTVEPRAGGAAVIVRDTGIGIPPEHQSRVFERFYRVDKNRSKQMGGTGLGLSIVKHGAIYHGAKLELESLPGHGTTVTVVFPKATFET